MWKLRTLAFAAAVVIASALVIWAQAAQPELPPGPMKAKATTACTECHDARIILQQRLSKAAWTKEVDKMVKWGAVVGAADRDPLIDYLSTNIPPDKAPYIAERSASTKGKK
jgi:hypothetical protein